MSALRKKKHAQGPDTTLPLINIVLLLILAFMMAGIFSDPLPDDFTPLRTVDGGEAQRDAAMMVLSIDADGQIIVDGVGVSDTDLEKSFSEITDLEGLVEFVADARAPAHLVIALLGSAERAGLTQVQIITVGRE